MFAIMEAERMDAFNSSIKVINACERHPQKQRGLFLPSEQQRLPQRAPLPQPDLQLAPPSLKRLLVLISAANWLLRSKPQILLFFRVSSRAVFPPKASATGAAAELWKLFRSGNANI